MIDPYKLGKDYAWLYSIPCKDAIKADDHVAIMPLDTESWSCVLCGAWGPYEEDE